MGLRGLGCSTDNRRSQQGSGTERIFRPGGFLSVCIDTLISDGVSKEKMCRKCFSGFDRYFKLHSTLQVKLLKAIGIRNGAFSQIQSLGRKRHRHLSQKIARPQATEVSFVGNIEHRAWVAAALHSSYRYLLILVIFTMCYTW